MNQAMKYGADQFFKYWSGGDNDPHYSLGEEENESLGYYLNGWLSRESAAIINFGGDYETYLLMVLYIMHELMQNPRALDYVISEGGQERRVRRNITGIFDVTGTETGYTFYEEHEFDPATFRVAMLESTLSLNTSRTS